MYVQCTYFNIWLKTFCSHCRYSLKKERTSYLALYIVSILFRKLFWPPERKIYVVLLFTTGACYLGQKWIMKRTYHSISAFQSRSGINSKSFPRINLRLGFKRPPSPVRDVILWLGFWMRLELSMRPGRWGTLLFLEGCGECIGVVTTCNQKFKIIRKIGKIENLKVDI